MSITDTRPATTHSHHPKAEDLQVIVYGHSGLFYWWPLWTAGYVMALLTWLHHDQVVIGSKPEWFHPSRNLGVIYTLLLLLLKRQDDLFRHWVIGLGSGDLHMQTMGGRGVEMNVANVLFVIGKISRIQRLIATKPDVPEQA